MPVKASKTKAAAKPVAKNSKTSAKAAPAKSGKAAPSARQVTPDGMRLDFSNVSSFDPVPKGAVVLELTSITEKQSKNDNPTLACEWIVVEPDEMPDGEGNMIGVQNRKVFDNPSLLPNALFRVKQILDGTEFEPEGEWDDVSVEEILAHLTVGTQVGATITHRDFNGEARHQVGKYITIEAAQELMQEQA